MSDEVLRGDVRCPRTPRTFLAHRLGLVAAEAGYDIAAWLCSLLATAWAARDLAGTSTQPSVVVPAALAVGLATLAEENIPPTVGFCEPDPACAVNVSSRARSVGGRTFLVKSVASGGTNYSLVVRANSPIHQATNSPTV